MGSETRSFLETVFDGKPDALYILIWTLSDKASHWFQRIDDAVRFVESLDNRDVYVGTGLSARDHGLYKRCKSDEIAGSVGVFVDIDLRSDAHPFSALPSTIEEALSILPPEFPPSFVIMTGNGIHAWFLFAEPYIFENDEERTFAASLANRWNTLIRDNARLKGLKFECLGDLARVLRIPGTLNCKVAADTKKVSIYTRANSRYNPSDLIEFLDDLRIPDREAEESASKQRAQQFLNMPVSIDLHATVPPGRLDDWIASDPRFKGTWYRQRQDLKDQSQSGYDLALAHFGLREGLRKQEIVDLITHHRRIHKQKPRTTPDYFERTLSKAAQHAPIANKSGADPEREALADPTDAGVEQQPTSDRDKIDLCRTLSGALGVQLLRMVKVLGDEPMYRMECVEGIISFSNVGKLILQASVRQAIAARVGKLIPQLKPLQWRNLADALLRACILEDGGEELESVGAARLWIRQYLADSIFIPSIAGQEPQDLRKPTVRNGQIAVCSSDFHLHLTKTRNQTVSIQTAVAMLSAVGAKVERVRGNQFKEQSRWMLPRDEFDPSDYASNVPGGSSRND
jgi:hypothetical protein